MDYSWVRLFAFESPCKVCEPSRERAELGSFEVLKEASWNCQDARHHKYRGKDGEERAE